MKNLSNLNLSSKKYIIFDLDGTLIDSIGIWNIIDYKIIKMLKNIDIDLKILQCEREKFIEQNMGNDVYLEYCDYIIEKYDLNILRDEFINERKYISKEYFEKNIDFKPNSVEVINELKNIGYILILATGTTGSQLDIYFNKNINIKNKINIATFDLILKKEDVINKKPSPEIYFKVLQHYNALPEECLIFEDSLHGVIAAKGAGIEVVNVYDSYSDKDRNKINELCDYKIDNYQEFLDILYSIDKY